MRSMSPGVTVALGALLSVGALVGATAIILGTHPGTAARLIVVGVAMVLAVVGGVMMLKDLTR